MIIQGIWNLRDSFKAKGATLVVLTTSGALVPTELAQDMLVLDDPLPTAADLNKIVDQILTDARHGQSGGRHCCSKPGAHLCSAETLLPAQGRRTRRGSRGEPHSRAFVRHFGRDRASFLAQGLGQFGGFAYELQDQSRHTLQDWRM